MYSPKGEGEDCTRQGFWYIYWRWELHLMLQTLASSPVGVFFCRDLCIKEMSYIYTCELEREKADLDHSLTLGEKV